MGDWGCRLDTIRGFSPPLKKTNIIQLMDNEQEIVAPTNDTVDSEQSEATVEVTEAEQQQFSDAEKKAYARAKVAESKLREAKAKIKELETKSVQTNSPATVPEELKLIARGLSDEEIDQAKVISKGKGVSLTEALKDPLFVAFQEKRTEERKKEDAKLGASRGSTASSTSVDTSKMTREEHMKHWKESLG